MSAITDWPALVGLVIILLVCLALLGFLIVDLVDQLRKKKL